MITKCEKCGKEVTGQFAFKLYSEEKVVNLPDNVYCHDCAIALAEEITRKLWRGRRKPNPVIQFQPIEKVRRSPGRSALARYLWDI